MTFKHNITFYFLLALISGTQFFAAAPLHSQDQFQNVPVTKNPFTNSQRITQPPLVKTVATNLRSFGVPFTINANDASFVEVQLYLSRDIGKTWTFYARQTTDKENFPFNAEQDGQYWFSLKTLNRDRQLIPEGDPQPELKIVVDTVKPKLDFRIESDAAGRVVCRWSAQDLNLSPETLQIYYQPVTASGPSKNWIKVPVQLNGTSRVGVYSDQIAWWPETTEQQLNVAVEIRDIAGNAAQVNRKITVPKTAWRHSSSAIAQITDAPNRGKRNGAGATSGSLQFPQPPESGFPRPLKTQETQFDSRQKTAQHPPSADCENGACEQNPKTHLTNSGIGSSAFNGKLVGSEVEFAAPPVPEGYQPRNLPENAIAIQPVNQHTNRGTVVWQSTVQQGAPKTQSSSSSTFGSSSSLAAQTSLGQTNQVHMNLPQTTPRRTVARPAANAPSNQAIMIRRGDQVIGQSSTKGATNQYRGLQSQAGINIPKPSLLPKIPEPQPGYSSTGNASFSSNRQTPSQPVAAPIPQANHGSRAPVQIIGSKRFRLEYGIDSIDPSGVARVDLWVTRDQGKTWSSWGHDPDSRSPFPVEVQDEGAYGFRIVVHSKDGLTGQGPASGDDADMWVVVDTQSPLARITSVPYGRQSEAGRLVINYSVSDTSLTLRPITLAYSGNPQGPWNLIEEGVRNEGRYVWKPQANVPDRIFLRIEANDKAGNVGVHILSQAIDVSGLIPRGTIHGVSPVGTKATSAGFRN